MLRCLFLVLFLSSLNATADVPVPPRMLAPQTAAEAWNVIHIATANVERLIRDERGLEVSDQISLCSPALRTLARSVVKPAAVPLLDEQTSQAFRLVNIITQNSMVENTGAMPVLLANFKKVLGELERGFDPTTVKAELHHCLNHPETVSSEAGVKCPLCEDRLVPRRIPYSFIHARADQPTIRLKRVPNDDALPTSGQDVRVDLHLSHSDEAPVLESELWPMHGERIQVIVTSPNLSDFEQITPEASGKPGQYHFVFHPKSAGTYRVRLALTPFTTGLPEYPSMDVAVAGESPAAMGQAGVSETMSSTVGDLEFHLAVTGTKGRQLRVGELQMLRLQVQRIGGEPVKDLEPFLNAFAHITAFYTEAGADTVLQLHPIGGDIVLPEVRGGPALDFKIYSPQAGRLRLFCEVQIRGERVIAPFSISVVP